MNSKGAAQIIRDTVTMDQILDLYGYRTKRGFMVCPFHADNGPSLKVYKGNRGWHCYGCHLGGSVIDFVMAHENCDFHTAVKAIDKAMHLGLLDPYENPYDAEDQQRIQQWLDDFAGALYSYLDALRANIEAQIKTDMIMVQELELVKNLDPERMKAEDYDFISQWKENSEYNEYRLGWIDGFREEVAAWRRKARRAGSASSRKK